MNKYTEITALLTEAASILNSKENSVITESIDTLLEATNTTKSKEVISDINKAIEEKDDKKLRIAISKFKEWFLSADPYAKHAGLRTTLNIIYVLFNTIILIFGGKIALDGVSGIIVDGAKLKFLLALITGIGTLFVLFKSIALVNEERDKIQEKQVDEFIKKFEKKVNELKKQLEDDKNDKTTKEYKAIAKAYKDAVEYLAWFKQRKADIISDNAIRESKKAYEDAKKAKKESEKAIEKENKDNYKEAKKELKEAKKSKDPQEIAEKKAKYKAAKSLIESAVEIIMSKSLNESVGVKDKSTDEVVKVFKTNKEASEWIINNGGNDKYQLTNRLK